ncbi:MAG: hypothetical protein AAGH89_12050 [Verrucomicrobiota bacterium]
MQTLRLRFLLPLTLLIFAALGVSSCVRVRIDPVEINLNVKLETVDQELDDFFAGLDAADPTLK